jgi:hypothetical protein
MPAQIEPKPLRRIAIAWGSFVAFFRKSIFTRQNSAAASASVLDFPWKPYESSGKK